MTTLNAEVTQYLEEHGEWVMANNCQYEMRMLMDWRVHELTNLFLARIAELEAENTRLKAQLTQSQEDYAEELLEHDPYKYDAIYGNSE